MKTLALSIRKIHKLLKDGSLTESNVKIIFKEPGERDLDALEDLSELVNDLLDDLDEDEDLDDEELEEDEDLEDSDARED